MMNSNKIFEIKKYELPEKEIIEKKLFHIFVFGLPRSGTSMMTHICELLGVKMFHTSEEKKNSYDHLGKEYHPNPTGFYEITKNNMEYFLKLASTPYSGCKMIIPVNGPRYSLVKMIPSKIIMMWRDPEEIRQSQNAFYAQNADIAYLRTALASEKLKLEEDKMDFIQVHYRNVIKNPSKEITRVKKFICSDKDIDAAISYVNPEAYRFDQDKIVIGL